MFYLHLSKTHLPEPIDGMVGGIYTFYPNAISSHPAFIDKISLSPRLSPSLSLTYLIAAKRATTLLSDFGIF
jgi:hypothetical protein